MDAVKFIKERDRMYEVAFQAPSLAYRHAKSAEQIVREVEEWSAAHPRKTQQDVFLERWPGASIGANGVLTIDSCKVEKSIKCNGMDCSKCRREFWMQEIE